MLTAYQHNKINRRYLKTNEDALTSSIFERLKYLPPKVFFDILSAACFSEFPELDYSDGYEIVFWPKWNSEGTSNSNYVEPDVFIQLKEEVIIIEAKRTDSKQQYKNQWINEITAYRNEYHEDLKKIHFIALGGLYTKKREVVLGTIIHKCTWERLLDNIKLYYNENRNNGLSADNNRTIEMILQDLINAFASFGFLTADWFNNFPVHLKISNRSYKIFK